MTTFYPATNGGFGQHSPLRRVGSTGSSAPIPDLPALAIEPKGSTRSGHSLGSFNHLGDAGKDRCRYRKAERLGGLEVQDHLELGRELHRKIARLLAA